MSAAPQIERYSPSFLRFPIQNNRTGFQPVYLPLILIVPGRRDLNGFQIPNSDITSLRFFVADAPDPAKVAGPFNTQLLVPNHDIFTLNIIRLQLLDKVITTDSRIYYNPENPEETRTFTEALEGDVFDYTTINGKINATIPFFRDADYYDVSAFTIDVEDLPRPKTYLFVWEVGYKRRIVFDDATATVKGPFCISDEDQIKQFNLPIQHPGDVHHEMFKKTPAFYFDAKPNIMALRDDNILKFYRPFADVLQDIFDEQQFLSNINHIDKIPAQLIPYLAFLIGWDLPNYPGVTDNVRRSILRSAVKLQKLKGSKRALVELFDIFGFSIDLINLWYSSNGKRLIAPGETLPKTIKDDEIKVIERCQVEPLVADYNTPGFGSFEVPLLFRTKSNISINAWLVKDGATRNALNEFVNDTTDNPDSLSNSCEQDINGFLVPRVLIDSLPASDSTIVSTSEVLLDINTGLGTAAMHDGTAVVNQINCLYDKERNVLKLNFDHHLDFSGGTRIFIFASYIYDKIIIPSQLENLRSNRFDVRVMLKNGDQPSSEVLEFLMNFLFKLKAFHSLLRKIIFKVELLDVYNVQDYCSDKFDDLQVPPPVLPSDEGSNECNEIAIRDNAKDEDLSLRAKIFAALEEEHAAWKALDNTHSLTDRDVPVNLPNGNECRFTKYGQDRVIQDPEVNPDIEDTRLPLCDITTPAPPYCFTGRVKAELDITPVLILTEIERCFPCQLSFGSGFYWLIATNNVILMMDGFGKYKGQLSRGFIGKKISQFNHPPVALHYTDRPYFIQKQFEHNQLLAYQRPSLEIEKDNLLFPAHRFPRMNAIQNDFTSTWQAKPWDFEDDELNASLITGTDGDEVLSFNNQFVIYEGNGLIPDISSFGEHEDRSFVVTHKIFMETAPNHPAIELDERFVITSENEINIDSSVPFDGIFDSFNHNCNKDFINGYPAEYDRFDVDVTAIDFDRDNSDGTDALGNALDLPVRSGSGVTALFTFGSQILLTKTDREYGYYKPYRFDCACERFGCGSSGGTDITAGEISISTCLLDQYRQPDGSYDFNCDQLDIEQKVILNEQLGVCSTRLDGFITNMLCINPGPDIQDNGSIYYKDEYDVIYIMQWTIKNNILDISYITKSPRVPGEPDSGFIRGLRLFRRGIITTTRQIYNVETGILINSVSDQKIDFIQINSICGDQPFADNFCYHWDCAVDEELDTPITIGPRWIDVNEITSGSECNDEVVWPDLILDSDGNVVSCSVATCNTPFEFYDVWSNVPLACT